MMDQVKTWFMEIGLRQLMPSAIRAAVLGVASWLIAREGMLSAYGIVSDAGTGIISKTELSIKKSNLIKTNNFYG